MSYNKQQIIDVRAKAQAALDAAFGPNVVKVAKSVYGDKLAITFEFTPGGAEERAAKEREDFNNMALMFGLKAEHYGAQIRVRGEPWQLVGFMPRRPKYPMLVRQIATGKELLLTESTVKSQLGISHRTFA